MKDYTKYDFGAIVGAEVEMKTRDSKGSCWNVKGKVRLQDNGLVWVERNEGKPWNDCIIVCDIIPGSLSAKIKVEDMSVKQLLRMMDEYKYKSPKLDENGIWFECSNGDKAVARFGKDIDCTDWGWK